MTAWIALGLTAETTIFVLAGFAWLRSKGYTLAEAFAGAVVMVFIGLSLIHQIDMAVGSALPGGILESAALAVTLSVCRRWLPQVTRSLASARAMLGQETLPGAVILAGWIVMAGLMVAQWTGGPAAFMPVSSGIAQSIITAHGSTPAWANTVPLPILNSPALYYHTARFGLGGNACGFGLLAYMALGCCTYALARRYAWSTMALTVALMVLSMPRLVFLGLHPSAEIISCVAVAFSLVLLYRLVEQHRAVDLRFFLLSLLFSIYSDPVSLILVPVMGLLLLIVMIRRHGWLLFKGLLTKRPHGAVLTLVPAVGLAHIPAGLLNLTHGYPFWGPEVAVDEIGIVAAGANLVRYLLAGIDFTEPVRQMLTWLVGVDLVHLLNESYKSLIGPLFAQAGVAAPFASILSGGGAMGFGPFAALLVLPAMMHALVRGPRRLKALCVAWAGYLYIAALVANWHPDRIAVLTPLLATCGFVVAFSLPPWRLRRRGMRLLQIDFALLLAWSIAHAGGGHG